MDVRLIPVKIKARLNKLDSSDYDNLQCWQIVEAYNKAQLEWARREAASGETSTRKVDDLQSLLTPVEILGSNRDFYFLSREIPSDYLEYVSLVVYGSKGSCKKQRILSHLREEANSENLLRDKNHRPSFLWRETFHTIVGDKIKVYTANDFTVSKVDLTYYRNPREIRIVGCDYLGTSSPTNVQPEFKDSIVEIIIDQAAAILAGDIENYNALQLTTGRSEKNN